MTTVNAVSEDTLYADEQTLLRTVTILEAYGKRRLANKVRKQLRYITKLCNAKQVGG
jgi:hypothetical protein